MKIFRSFVSTLPGSNGYYAGLSAISELYRQMKDSNKHKDAVLAHYDRLSVDLLVFEINYQAVRRQDFIESWEKVSKFMESILSFSRSYPSFFLNKLSVIEGESDFSLGSIHGQLNELMNNISETSDFSRMQSLMSVFKDKFLDQNAEIAKIFREISTPNSVERIIEFFTQESNVASRLEIETIVRDTPTVDIPYSILDEIVFKEVITNLRHSDPRKPICLHFNRDNGFLRITITNDTTTINPLPGGGAGLLLLDRLNEFPENIISYSRPKRLETDPFQQEIKIKII
jgi:hypothetical protein